MTRPCVLCGKYGASVKCSASGDFYHWPCATASGSFMHKSSQTLVGHNHLDQVPKYGKSLLYYTQWFVSDDFLANANK